jgi:hypothetical protein
MSISVMDILRGTPVWVFVLFAYLLWSGSKRRRVSVQPFRRLFIAPAIFVAWGLLGLFEGSSAFAPTLARWLLAAVLGAALGCLAAPKLQRDGERNAVRVPGSAIPLLRNIAIFAAHYLLRVAAVIEPQARDTLLGWDIGVSGASAGYFIGWAWRCLQHYRTAALTHPPAALATPGSLHTRLS